MDHMSILNLTVEGDAAAQVLLLLTRQGRSRSSFHLQACVTPGVLNAPH